MLKNIIVKVVENHIEEKIEKKNEGVAAALEVIGMDLERHAKELCPEGSPESTGIPGYIGGTLRSSIAYATANHTGTTITVTKKNADPYDESKKHGGYNEPASTEEKDCVYIGTNVFYAPFVEFGTYSGGDPSGMRPRPYIKPALTDHMAEYEKTLNEEVKKRLE